MSFSVYIILTFMVAIGIAAMAYFIADVITSYCDSKTDNDIATKAIDLATLDKKLLKTLAELEADLLAAKRAFTIAKIQQDPNAIIIGYNDKPAKTRRTPHIELNQ